MIVDYEAANSAAYDLAVHRDQVSKSFIERAEAGIACSAEQYDEALSIVFNAQNALDAAMGDVDVLLCPSAPGEAPKGLSATGNPIFSRMGTALRVPCLSIPGLSGHSSLPIGVQLVGRYKDDRRVLAIGEWLHALLQPQ